MNNFSMNLMRAKLACRRGGQDQPWHLVCDVDGVLTDGKFHYSDEGKVFKVFGSHDADALKQDRFFDNVSFISADKRGFPISLKRIEDMGFSLTLKSSAERVALVKEIMTTSRVAFIGDSFSDVAALRAATLSAAPKNAFPDARKAADIRLRLGGGEGAIAEFLLLMRAASQRNSLGF